MGFFTGTPERKETYSNLRQDQEPILQQLLAALRGKGAGGAYGESADYYRDLLDPNGSNYKSLEAPEMRQYNEQIIPGLSEQFAGMGSGGLSSSGFRNAAVSAGTDLSERLGAIRANLRNQGAQGLQQMGNQGLQQYQENVIRPSSAGFLEQAAPAIGAGLTAFGGPIAGMAGTAAANWLSQSMKGKSSPYGAPTAPTAPQRPRGF